MGAVTGTFTGTGNSATFAAKGKISVLIDGGNAVVEIQRSFDKGATWYPISRDSEGNPASYNPNTLGFNGFIDEPEFGILYRLACITYTSGTVTYRIGGPKNA